MNLKDYKWELTSDGHKLIWEIEILQKVFEKLPIPPEAAKKLLRTSLLNSAVSSARIEDIPSTVDNPRKEGNNLFRAYRDVYTSFQTKPLTVGIIQDLHSKAMQGLSGMAGKFRTEPWGIFNQAGIEIHHAPLHIYVPKLVSNLTKFITRLKDEHPCVVSAITQFILEKIHPFADGNGRAGRLVSAYLLQRSGFGFGGLISLENYINQHRNWYYQSLEPSHNCTGFIEFYLGAIVSQANKTLDEIKNPPTESPESNLMPRRRELLEIIRDHPECTFNFLARRFVQVKPLAIHRDLAFLQKKALVKKLGSTRGAVYIANN